MQTITLSSGYVLEFPKTKTIWHIYKKNFNSRFESFVGKIIFERRLAEQSDFVMRKNDRILMSFDEMACAFDSIQMGGWGIDANKFSDDLKIFVKQFRNPLDTRMILNLQLSYDKFYKNFDYIKLYSDSTHDSLLLQEQLKELQKSGFKKMSV